MKVFPFIIVHRSFKFISPIPRKINGIAEGSPNFFKCPVISERWGKSEK